MSKQDQPSLDKPPGIFTNGSPTKKPKVSDPQPTIPPSPKAEGVKRPAKPSCAPEQVNLDSGVPTVSQPDANAKLESLVQQYGAAQIVKIVRYYEVLRDTMP